MESGNRELLPIAEVGPGGTSEVKFIVLHGSKRLHEIQLFSDPDLRWSGFMIGKSIS